MNELALFAGAGGGILGGKLLGWRTVCAVEWEPYAACVLAARQNDGLLPPFPIWDDVQTFDGKPWRGIVDVVSGGFPCQDISAAGKGAGIDGERSGMWKEMARIVSEVRPKFVFVENSPMLTSRGLGVVLGDLATLGYDAEWGVISAADTGAPHLRERIWICAKQRGLFSYPELQWARRREQQPQGFEETDGTNVANASQLLCNGGNDNAGISVERKAESEFRNNCGSENVANTDSAQRQGNWSAKRIQKKHANFGGASNVVNSGCGRHKSSQSEIRPRWNRFINTSWWTIEPNVGRVANGVAARVDRLKAIGNGQVPRVAATAFEILNENKEM